MGMSVLAIATVVSAEVARSPDAIASLAVGKDTLGQAFASSFAMIMVSELGDKTFFIAAILAMRQDRRFVFIGAAGALAAMTMLSAGIGVILPALISPQYTQWAAIFLFVFFGVQLLREAYGMFSNGQGEGPSGELEEVEKSLGDKDKKSRSTAAQAFVLTFLAEWGDRSQIATIALAAARSPVGVTLGGVVGHGCCTALAVLGGRVLAARISERAIVTAGGVLFMVFALHGFLTEIL
jgi:putative Ca2+/H+ antiporter (TMEM165/GDT1 family)